MWADFLCVAEATSANRPTADGAEKKASGGATGRNVSLGIQSKIDLGARAFACLAEFGGEGVATAWATAVTQQASRKNAVAGPAPSHSEDRGEGGGEGGGIMATTPRVPYGFWGHFLKNLGALNTAQKQTQAVRAMVHYVLQRAKGAETAPALRDGLPADRNRNSGSAENSTKAAGLSFTLFQFFVDHVQKLNARSDSLLLMGHARQCRLHLLAHGWGDRELPKLSGNAGCQWLSRWRKNWRIVKKCTGMKLKVSWKKVMRRVKTLLVNIMRRAFYITSKRPCRSHHIGVV